MTQRVTQNSALFSLGADLWRRMRLNLPNNLRLRLRKEVADAHRIASFVRFFRRERRGDFLETRIAAQRIPEWVQF